jgi:hypothetical protein
MEFGLCKISPSAHSLSIGYHRSLNEIMFINLLAQSASTRSCKHYTSEQISLMMHGAFDSAELCILRRVTLTNHNSDKLRAPLQPQHWKIFVQKQHKHRRTQSLSMATPPRRSGRQPLTTPVYLFPTYQRRQSATSDMSSSITTPSNAPTLSRSSCDSNHGGSVRRIDLQDSNAARNFPRTSSMHVPSASVGFRQGTVRVISTPRRESCRKVVRREETPESEVGDGPEDEEPDPPCIPNHNSARASISSATTLAGSIFSELYDGGSEDEGNGYDEVKNSNNDNSYETVQDVIRQADCKYILHMIALNTRDGINMPV